MPCIRAHPFTPSLLHYPVHSLSLEVHQITFTSIIICNKSTVIWSNRIIITAIFTGSNSTVRSSDCSTKYTSNFTTVTSNNSTVNWSMLHLFFYQLCILTASQTAQHWFNTPQLEHQIPYFELPFWQHIFLSKGIFKWLFKYSSTADKYFFSKIPGQLTLQ